MSLQQQASARRLKPQQSFTSSNSIPTTESSSHEQMVIPTISTEPSKSASTTAVSSKYGIHVAQRNKVAMQKLANSFVELNKRKAEKRDLGHTTWRTLIKGVLDLQKGKIPLLLAVEAGNQSMCRELLSSQTAEQLKVNNEINVKQCSRNFRNFVFTINFVIVVAFIYLTGNHRKWRYRLTFGGTTS